MSKSLSSDLVESDQPDRPV